MKAFFAVLLLVAAGRLWGVRGRRLAAWAAGLWALALGAALVMPGGAVARATGGARVWVVIGIAWAALCGYRAGLGWLDRRARGLAPAAPAPGAEPFAARPPNAGPPDAGPSLSETPAAPPAAPPAAAGRQNGSFDGPLSDDELDRYARHIVLRELGGAGQRRLRAARVLVVGAGGLGAPVLQYLAAAGVGRITVADDDRVSLSNLQRQVIFGTGDLGRAKVDAAAEALARLNPHVVVTPLARRITAQDGALVAGHDLVLDGTDSFDARAAVNRAAVAARVPLIAGSIAQWEGQVALYDPARGGPCMACLFPDAPAAGLALPCAEAGVVGALAGTVGSLMAIEAIKLIAAIPDSGAGAGLRERMILFDGLWGETRTIATRARPGCPVCGGGGAAAGIAEAKR